MRTSNLFTASARRGTARPIAAFLLMLLLGTASAAAQGQGILRIVSPNGGETVVVDSTVHIRWFATGITGTLTVEYSADSGATWKFVDTAVAKTGVDSVAWLVPKEPTKLALVRVGTAGGQRTGRSMRTFTIATEPPKTLRMIYPNGGETIVIDSTVKVVWNTQNITGNLDVEYSVDSAKSWKSIRMKTAAKTGNDTILWKVPNEPSTTAFVRVSTEDDQVTARSGRTFSIVKELPKTLRVIQPNGGELFEADSSVRVTWLSGNITGDIRIDYSVDSGKVWKPIRTVTAKNGNDTTTWKIPNDTTSRGLLRVSTGDGSLSDASNSVFSIRTQLNPGIKLLAPNGGEKFRADSTTRIIWTAQDLTGTIAASYSVDTGRTWKPMMGSRPARAGLDTIVWKVPNDPSTMTMLRVGNSSARDTTDLPFTIIGTPDSLSPKITIIRPNGGEVFKAGTPETLSWETKNLTGQLNIHYSADSGRTWKMLPGRTAVAGIDSVQWIVPNDPTTRATLRVTLSGSGGGGGGGGGAGVIRDFSDAVFTILGTEIDTSASYLQLIYPNGGERLRGDSTITIRWKANNLGGRLFLAYSADGGQWTVIDSANARQGNDSLTWSVPNMNSTNTYILVSTADGLVKDVTDNGFRLLSTGTSGVNTPSNVPGGMTLIGSFPDPASSSTEIRWTQNAAGHVLLRVYDLNGRAVQTVNVGQREAGEMRTVLDVSKLAPGMYVYELTNGAGSLRGGLRVDR